MSENSRIDLSRRDTERHILAAVDESPNSRRTVQYLADFFGNLPEVFVTLLSVVQEPDQDCCPTEEDAASRVSQAEEKARACLQSYRATLVDGGFPEDRVEMRLCRTRTTVAEAILAEQDKLRCCIVVVGRRGVSHREEFLFGSVSNHILHRATNCAVMVIE